MCHQASSHWAAVYFYTCFLPITYMIKFKFTGMGSHRLLLQLLPSTKLLHILLPSLGKILPHSQLIKCQPSVKTQLDDHLLLSGLSGLSQAKGTSSPPLLPWPGPLPMAPSWHVYQEMDGVFHLPHEIKSCLRKRTQ